MKKSFLIAAGAALAAIAVSVFVYANNGKNEMDDLFYANVEALARNEGGGFGPICSQTGYRGTHYMKLCSNCSVPMGNYDNSRVAFCAN